MKNADMPAMPVALTDEQLNKYQHPTLVLSANRGLTKREYMAARIASAMLKSGDVELGNLIENDFIKQNFAAAAVATADALLAALEEKTQ